MKRGSWLLLAAIGACFAARVSAQFVTPNLLSNPGSEMGLSSWNIIAGPPRPDNGNFDPGINPRTGMFDFVGANNNPFAQLDQTIDLIATGQVTAPQLDSGSTTADVSFWEQGLNQGSPSDNAAIQLSFLDASGTLISMVTTATVDSHTGSWANGAQSFLVPVGTRFITYSMLFQRNVGSDNDAFIDDNSLTLTIAPVPEPATVALLLAGLPVTALALRRLRRTKTGLRSSA